jgi:chromosome segregation ATPase
MKNPLQSLLILLSMCLCGLISWQWYGQALQHRQMSSLSQTIYDQAVSIQGYTNSIRTMDKQIADMEAHLTEFRDTIRSNNLTIATLRQDAHVFSNQVEQYKVALEASREQIQQANESIRRQNDSIKDVVAQRDEYVTKLNESIKERNELVGQYNDLVKRVQEMQAAQTNKAAAKK